MRRVVSADPAGNLSRMTPQSTERSGSVPGRKWYAMTVLVFLAGMMLFVVFLNVRMSTFGDDFVRVTVPGQAELTLDPGSYTIYHERGGMMDGRGGDVVTTDDITGLRINVLKPGSGAAVPLTTRAGISYTVHGRPGQSLFTFTLTEPGTYRLVATYDDARPGSPAVLAITPGFAWDVVMTVLGSVAIAFGGLAIALAIGLNVYRRRRSALGPSIQYVPNGKIMLAFYFDLTTGWLLGVFVTELLTVLLAKGGFSLPVWLWVLVFAVMGGYFVVSEWLFGRTLWERILKTDRRPDMET